MVIKPGLHLIISPAELVNIISTQNRITDAQKIFRQIFAQLQAQRANMESDNKIQQSATEQQAKSQLVKVDAEDETLVGLTEGGITIEDDFTDQQMALVLANDDESFKGERQLVYLSPKSTGAMGGLLEYSIFSRNDEEIGYDLLQDSGIGEDNNLSFGLMA